LVNDDSQNSNITLALTSSRDSLLFIALDGITFTAGRNGSPSITIQGSKAAINACLRSLIYEAGAPGAETISYTFNDGGATGVGSALSASGLINVTILPKPLRPPPPLPFSINVAPDAGNALPTAVPLTSDALQTVVRAKATELTGGISGGGFVAGGLGAIGPGGEGLGRALGLRPGPPGLGGELGLQASPPTLSGEVGLRPGPPGLSGEVRSQAVLQVEAGEASLLANVPGGVTVAGKAAGEAGAAGQSSAQSEQSGPVAPAGPTSPSVSADGGFRTTAIGSGGEGFRVAVPPEGSGGLEAGKNLEVFKGIADVAVADNRRVSFAIPPDAFAAQSADAVIVLSAQQADGQALPNWISFDPTTGKFIGDIQPDFEGTLEVLVTATDQDGNTVTTSFSIGQGEAIEAPASDQQSNIMLLLKRKAKGAQTDNNQEGHPGFGVQLASVSSTEKIPTQGQIREAVRALRRAG